MTERTTTTKVTFHNPADLEGLTEALPAGEYVVETDEEVILGLSFLAYRRLRTTIIVPSRIGAPMARQMIEIDPDSLTAALARDAMASARASAP